MNLDYYARYYVEHKALPRALYTEGVRLLRSFMLEGQDAILGYYNKVSNINQMYKCPYNRADFDVNFRTYVRGEESCVVLRVEMPQPEEPLLCRAIYLCYGTRGGYELYVTSELTEMGSYCICCWTDTVCHMNFGDAPVDPNDEMDMAAELFWNSVCSFS